MTGKTSGLPAPFENTYFRDRALKAANRQRQGHILVSGAMPDNGQGLPLPYIHDIPGLLRGSYPYDYECEWGRFKYSYGNPVKYIDPDGHCPKPASGSGNVICVDLFIQSKTIVFGLGRGDNRGFDTNSAPEASRSYAYIYLDDSGNVIGSEVSVNQSCTVVGCFGPVDEFNDFSVSQESAGGDINITWNLLNGVSGELREHANEAYEEESSIGAMPLYSNMALASSYGLASINGEMTLSLGDDGNYQITSLDRDPYPSLEVYFYKDGDYQYTLGQFKEKYGPFIGLSPIAPNQRITAR